MLASPRGDATSPTPVASYSEATSPPPAAGQAIVRGSYWLQLGAFRQHNGAVSFRRQVEGQADWLSPLLTVFGDAALFKLQAGPYVSREDARDAAVRLRAVLQLVPVIVERR